MHMRASKNEARETDCHYCREKDAMLTDLAKIPRCDGTSCHVAFMANCLAVSHTFQPYLPNR